MARKNEFNYFELKAEADKESRGNFILNMPEGDPIVVTPFSVEKTLDADPTGDLHDQMKYAMGDEQWERLYELIKGEDFGVLEKIAKSFSDHFFGDDENVPGGKRRSSRR